jgi:hypothetical protein
MWMATACAAATVIIWKVSTYQRIDQTHNSTEKKIEAVDCICAWWFTDMVLCCAVRCRVTLLILERCALSGGLMGPLSAWVCCINKTILNHQYSTVGRHVAIR